MLEDVIDKGRDEYTSETIQSIKSLHGIGSRLFYLGAEYLRAEYNFSLKFNNNNNGYF